MVKRDAWMCCCHSDLFPLQQAVGRGANGAERSSILDVLSDDYQLSLTYDDLCHDAMPVSICFPLSLRTFKPSQADAG